MKGKSTAPSAEMVEANTANESGSQSSIKPVDEIFVLIRSYERHDDLNLWKITSEAMDDPSYTRTNLSFRRSILIHTVWNTKMNDRSKCRSYTI